MATTAEEFDEFDENLKLDPQERVAAEKMHTEVTALLRRNGVIASAFLQGSFARKTMIKPLRDVDKVVVLAEAMATCTPDEVMDRIQFIAAEAYPDARFDRSRHALQIDFGPASFYFDTVPAWESDGDDDDVLIANRDTGNWDRSNTRSLIRVVSERNGDTNGRFIHQVRMGKHTVKNLLADLIPGIHVESWAYVAIEQPLAHDEALARILDMGAELLGGSYTDPTGVDRISSRLGADVVREAKPVLGRAAERAAEALALTEVGEHAEAIRIWSELCGDGFPAPVPQSDGDALRRAFLGGSVTSAGTVSRSRSIGQSSRPARSWRRA